MEYINDEVTDYYNLRKAQIQCLKEEKLEDMTKSNVRAIQEFYKNDIRSMINFMQVNKKSRKTNIIVI